MRRVLALAVLLAALGGCGDTTEVREPDLVAPRDGTEGIPADGEVSQARISVAVVTHGQASSSFWTIVRNGIDAARRQMNVDVTYRSPDVYSVERMSTLIDEAVERRPDGLVVSIPSPDLAPAIRRAVRAGVPVVSINSGSDVSRAVGALAHVGQPEDRAGRQAGLRLAELGVRRALCINQEVGNAGLDLRCRALQRALRSTGGRSRVLAIDIKDLPGATQKLVDALRRDRAVDGVLALNNGGAKVAVDAVRAAGREGEVTIGTFDLSPDVLQAVQDGRIVFAIDQQAYLQGYLPIVMLTERVRHGLFPAEGDVVATGPNFVTRETAAQALELSRKGIR